MFLPFAVPRKASTRKAIDTNIANISSVDLQIGRERFYFMQRHRKQSYRTFTFRMIIIYWNFVTFSHNATRVKHENERNFLIKRSTRNWIFPGERRPKCNKDSLFDQKLPLYNLCLKFKISSDCQSMTVVLLTVRDDAPPYIDKETTCGNCSLQGKNTTLEPSVCFSVSFQCTLSFIESFLDK